MATRSSGICVDEGTTAPSVPPGSLRARWLICLVVGFWVVLAVRLVVIQGHRGRELAQRAHAQWVVVEDVPARPGDILDRRGRLLATTITQKSLYVVPSRIEDVDLIARRIATALRLDADRLADRIRSHRSAAFLWVARRLADEQVEAILELRLPRTVYGFRDEYRRVYPQASLAAQVLGFRDIDGHGRGGIEQSMDAVLRGRPGRRRLLRDAYGKVIDVRQHPADVAVPGNDVVLTLDSVIQIAAERSLERLWHEYRPRGACAIVLRPATGEILAMASRPTFDPNNPRPAATDAWRNRAIHDAYEPGSTFKPFVVARALADGVIDRESRFDCEHGAYRMGRRVLRDHHPYGELNVADILVKSSNIGMAKIGQLMGNAALYRTAVEFGFGSRTGIELPGERTGTLRPLTAWNSYSTGSVPMGQEIAVTPLQLIVAHAALANRGRWIAPRIVLRDPRSAHRIRAPIVTTTVPAEVADWIISIPLTECVRRGTGRRAKLSGVEVFGKTGTAQKAQPAGGGYAPGRYVCSFVCGAPSHRPRVMVLVVVDEPSGPGPHFGGTVAAPAARDILQAALQSLQALDDEPLAGSHPPSL